MRKTFIFTIIVLGLAAPATAQEAFVAQIGGLQVSAQVPVRVAVPMQDLQVAARTLMPAFQNAAAPFRDDLLPGVPTGGPIASVSQSGDTNTASIVQSGRHAALIRQSASFSTATIQQGGGAMSRAAIFQTSNRSSGAISQTGSNNRALIIQN